jgi:hypothetical protein
LASTSRTLRARIGMMGASSSRRDDEGFLRRWFVEPWGDEPWPVDFCAADAVVGMLLLSVSAGMLRR